MGRVYPENGNIVVEGDDGHIIWSTAIKPVNLLPDAYAITLTEFDIEFPDFAKRFAYAYADWVEVPFPGLEILMDGCTSVMTLRPGEYSLPDILVGTVPLGVNYVDIRVNLSRTVNPVGFGSVPVPMEIAPGQTTFIPGGSCVIETFLDYARMFWFEINGSNIILKRKQSVAPGGPPPSWQTGGGDLSATSSPYTVMQSKSGSYGESNIRPRRLGGSDACRTDVNHAAFSTRSVYTGTVIIRPGYIAP